MTTASPPSNAIQLTAGEAPVVIGPREQLFHLIAEASEIEHTLMCSYLYAAFSLKRGENSGLSAAEAEAVARWRKTILSVATDEMVHLLLVANLSIAIGGRPHFGRPNFPVVAGYFPSGVVARLTPFSLETLEHFVFLERPRGSAHVDAEGFEPDTEYQREEAYHGLMPSVQDYATVGHLYDALRVNLTACAARLGESALFIGPVTAQVGHDVASLEGVATIDSLESALHAIAVIVEQGEGSPGDRIDSHYHRFVAIREEFAALRAANPDFAPAWPVAENPVMRRPPEPADKIFVDHADAARLLDFANAVYGQLLRFLVQAFGRQGPRAAQLQAAYMSAAIELMHLLNRAATALVSLPASDSTPGVNAGMTFTMLRSVEPFFIGAAEGQLVRERLLELGEGARGVANLAPGLSHIEDEISALERKLCAALLEANG